MDIGFLADPIDDGSVILVDAYPLGATEHRERHVFEFDAKILADELTAGRDRV
jgi:hypothetical protein